MVPEGKGCKTPSWVSLLCMHAAVLEILWTPMMEWDVSAAVHEIHTTCGAPGHTDGQLPHNPESAASLQLLLPCTGCIRLGRPSVSWEGTWHQHVLRDNTHQQIRSMVHACQTRLPILSLCSRSSHMEAAHFAAPPMSSVFLQISIAAFMSLSARSRAATASQLQVHIWVIINWRPNGKMLLCVPFQFSAHTQVATSMDACCLDLTTWQCHNTASDASL